MSLATPTRLALGTLVYVFASFAVQAASHFAINAEHFASIPFMRPEPIMLMGVGVMLAQGLTLSWMFGRFARQDTLRADGLRFGLAAGVFLGAYIALVEPSKYVVPSIGTWIAVEGIAALIQFTLFGLGLGFVYRVGSQTEST